MRVFTSTSLLAAVELLLADVVSGRSPEKGGTSSQLRGSGLVLASCPRKEIGFHTAERICSIPIDESASTESWKPWTHRPFCVSLGDESDDLGHGQTTSTERDEDELEDDTTEEATEGPPRIKWCTFTSSYSGNHGISVMARPEAGADVASLLREIYNSDFPSRQTVKFLNLEPAFTVVDIPEKGGKGLVATRHISSLETFLVDYPSIIADASIWGAVSVTQGIQLLHHAAEQLANPDEVLGLSQGRGSIIGDPVDAVLRTNTFRVQMGGVPQKVLYPVISRINHDCRPNAFIRHSNTGLIAGIAAFRDIEAGEEITISYIPLGQTSEQREHMLHEWGFTCSCSLCEADEDVAETSDERRAKISSVKTDVAKAIQGWDLRGAVRILKESLKHMKEEGLEAAASEVHESLGRIYWVLGENKTAAAHARKAVELRDNYGNIDPVDREGEFNRMMKDFQ